MLHSVHMHARLRTRCVCDLNTGSKHVCPCVPRPDDPDAIKLLKRELAVAVREEDYRAAARIRDHPYMVLYRRMAALRSEGMLREADDVSTELWSLIALNQQ